MTDQYVPALRQRFLEDMRIKGLQPKTHMGTIRFIRPREQSVDRRRHRHG